LLKTIASPSRAPTDAEWAAIVGRDPGQDGLWIFAVRTTRVQCRPSCSSRRPRRENVRIFETVDAARDAGYRPCLRCRPDAPASETGADLAQKAGRLLVRQPGDPKPLKILADQVGTSPSRLHRAFQKHLGVTPAEFLRSVRRANVQTMLSSGSSVHDATRAVGHRSSSRMYGDRHDLGMTPDAYRRRGESQRISYASAPSPLGVVLVASTPRGVCSVRLGDDGTQLVAQLRQEFSNAQIHEDPGALKDVLAEVLSRVQGRAPHATIALDLQATAFRQRVWAELQRIPLGQTRTYAQMAHAIGSPASVRAVANACAANPAAVVVPCHRVVGSDGSLTGYRWGLHRKRALLAAEKDHAEPDHG
jgi:AraC family transcriptional regulator of adaptative response/methylated-DNA-[protein]-cysteine methyltransferase